MAQTEPRGSGDRLRAALLRGTRPLRRMWSSDDELEDYGLVHLTSVAGDTLVLLALADSIFFSLPVGEAKAQVALYLALTMAPLAVAGPALIPLLDRSPYRRAISFGAGTGRAIGAIFLARWLGSLPAFPMTFVILVLSKIHVIAKNGLTWAYAPSRQDLVSSNAFLGRVAVVGAAMAAAVGIPILWLGGAEGLVFLAVAVYGTSALLNLRLPPAEVPASLTQAQVDRRGRVAALAPAAVGYGGLRAAQGFLLALVAFALREAGSPTYWYGVLVATATIGAALGDLVAPRLPRALREEVVVLGSAVAAGVAALFTFQTFSLGTLALFAGLAGMATEFGRLGFQSLMQGAAPGGAQGRVFVRYEVAFQLAWVGGAVVPSMLPVPFRGGVLLIAVFYLVLGIPYLLRPYLRRRRERERGPRLPGER